MRKHRIVVTVFNVNEEYVGTCTEAEDAAVLLLKQPIYDEIAPGPTIRLPDIEHATSKTLYTLKEGDTLESVIVDIERVMNAVHEGRYGDVEEQESKED